MFGLHALRQMFNSTQTSIAGETATLEDMLSNGTVAVVSAACCDAMSTPRDEELAANLAAALNTTGLTRPVALGTLTSTRQQLRDQASTLKGCAVEFRDHLGSLFQTEGLAAFPVLLVDGKIAFYGGVPSVTAIAEKLALPMPGTRPGI
jgi:hypothetical protein